MPNALRCCGDVGFEKGFRSSQSCGAARAPEGKTIWQTSGDCGVSILSLLSVRDHRTCKTQCCLHGRSKNTPCLEGGPGGHARYVARPPRRAPITTSAARVLLCMLRQCRQRWPHVVTFRGRGAGARSRLSSRLPVAMPWGHITFSVRVRSRWQHCPAGWKMSV